jgi:hypothetical protein
MAAVPQLDGAAQDEHTARADGGHRSGAALPHRATIRARRNAYKPSPSRHETDVSLGRRTAPAEQEPAALSRCCWHLPDGGKIGVVSQRAEVSRLGGKFKFAAGGLCLTRDMLTAQLGPCDQQQKTSGALLNLLAPCA